MIIKEKNPQARLSTEKLIQYLELEDEHPTIWVQLRWGNIQCLQNRALKLGQRQLHT